MTEQLPQSKDAIAALIPHQGTMCLLDRVEAWTVDQVTCTTRSHLAADNPLRRDGRLAAVHLCEYGAQAVAVHGAIAAAKEGLGTVRPAVLVALRDVTLVDDDISCADRLEVQAKRMQQSAAGWLYRFCVTGAGRVLATGRVTIMPTQIHP